MRSFLGGNFYFPLFLCTKIWNYQQKLFKFALTNDFLKHLKRKTNEKNCYSDHPDRSALPFNVFR